MSISAARRLLPVGRPGSAVAPSFLRGGQRSRLGIEIAGDVLRIAQHLRRGSAGHWMCGDLSLPSQAAAPAAAGRGARCAPAAAGCRFSGGRATAVCTSPLIDVFPLNLERDDDAPVAQRVVEQARDRLDYPIEEAVLDFSLLPPVVQRPGDEHLTVLVYTAPRQLIEHWVATLDRFDWYVDCLLTPACVLAPRIEHPLRDARHLVISIAGVATSLSVVQFGEVLLERILPWGAQGLVERLQVELDLSAAQSERLLQQSDPASTVQEILTPLFAELVQEADGCLAYCDAYFSPTTTTSLLLVGTLAAHPALQRFFDREMGLPRRDPTQGLRLPGDEGVDPAFAPAVCSALWEPEGEA